MHNHRLVKTLKGITPCLCILKQVILLHIYVSWHSAALLGLPTPQHSAAYFKNMHVLLWFTDSRHCTNPTQPLAGCVTGTPCRRRFVYVHWCTAFVFLFFAVAPNNFWSYNRCFLTLLWAFYSPLNNCCNGKNCTSNIYINALVCFSFENKSQPNIHILLAWIALHIVYSEVNCKSTRAAAFHCSGYCWFKCIYKPV